MRRKHPPFVLAIGGLDPSCSAGVVADARTIAAMGAMPLVVATSMTVQSGRGLRSFRAAPADIVAAQIDELAANLPIAAVKIGQVPDAKLVRLVSRKLDALGVPVVLDPVLRASGGGALVSRDAPAAILSKLLPRADLVTVNLSEASALAGIAVTNVSAMRRAAQILESRGARAVLVKGGHLAASPVDLLRADGEETVFRGSRIRATGVSAVMHGTGCALASAVAARLACGDSREEAVRRARAHVRGLLRGAIEVRRRRLRAPESY